MQNRQRRQRSSKLAAAARASSRPELRKNGPSERATLSDPSSDLLVAPSRDEPYREQTAREPLTKRLNRKRSLVANDNLGRSRKKKPSTMGAARPFGQKVVLFLVWFTVVMLTTLVTTTLFLETPLSFGSNLGFSISLACVVAFIPVVDTIARIVSISFSVMMIGLYAFFTTGS
ncbi:MAG: hypothetical protein ABJO09_08235 [Hyphomicrobiales bacterium]